MGTILQKVTDKRDEQSSKALSPIDETDSGIVIFFIEEQLPKASFPIILIDLGNDNSLRDSQPTNAESPMILTESGIIIDCKFKHSAKTELPIFTTVFGIVNRAID